jgi:hypothetical protein
MNLLPLSIEMLILFAPLILEKVVSPPQLRVAMLANWGSGVVLVTLSWKKNHFKISLTEYIKNFTDEKFAKYLIEFEVNIQAKMRNWV